MSLVMFVRIVTVCTVIEADIEFDNNLLTFEDCDWFVNSSITGIMGSWFKEVVAQDNTVRMFLKCGGHLTHIDVVAFSKVLNQYPKLN